MFFIESMATESLLLSYKARFRRDKTEEVYLFHVDDYGAGVPCSNETYEIYVGEFETFLRKKSRFMIWWFVVMLIVASLGFFMAIKYAKSESLETYSSGWFGAVWMVLPLLYIIHKGWKLYQKPSVELKSNEIGRERQSRDEIIHKRMRGMSYRIPIIGGLFSALGLYFDIYKIYGGYDTLYMRYFFEIALLGFVWLGVKKYLANKKENKG